MKRRQASRLCYLFRQNFPRAFLLDVCKLPYCHLHQLSTDHGPNQGTLAQIYVLPLSFQLNLKDSIVDQKLQLRLDISSHAFSPFHNGHHSTYSQRIIYAITNSNHPAT